MAPFDFVDSMAILVCMKRLLTFAVLLVIITTCCYYYFPYTAMPANVVIDRIEVQKSKHQLFVYNHDRLIKSITIAIGKNAVGAKQVEGDLKTPEGEYSIVSKNSKSAFHKSLLFSYPNANDKKVAASMNASPGGEVEIHGLRSDFAFLKRFQRWKDWTDGCIALTNDEVDDLYNHTPIGTRIIIHP